MLGLAASQHGVVTRAQLLALGLTADAIRYRLRRGRLHLVGRGVYAVGRPELTRHGSLFAAVLGCGPDAALSHASAAELWEIRRRVPGPIEVTVPAGPPDGEPASGFTGEAGRRRRAATASQ